MIFGISLIRDEADIVEQTVSRMAAQVDRVIVLDNRSVDGTREILERLPVTVLDDDEPAHYQSHKLSWLAQRAREQGATWVVPFDADEVWLPRTHMPMRAALATLPGHILIAQADLYDHVATAADPDGDPVSRIRWRRREPGPFPKVACRALEGLVIHDGNHGAHYAEHAHPGTVSNLLTIRHFPYRSPEQMVRKARNGAQALALTELPEDTGKHWRDYGRLIDAHGEEALHGVFREHFWSATPRRDGLVYDPCP